MPKSTVLVLPTWKWSKLDSDIKALCPGLSCHGRRHSYKTAIRESQITYDAREYILWHAAPGGDISSRYALRLRIGLSEGLGQSQSERRFLDAAFDTNSLDNSKHHNSIAQKAACVSKWNQWVSPLQKLNRIHTCHSMNLDIYKHHAQALSNNFFIHSTQSHVKESKQTEWQNRD